MTDTVIIAQTQNKQLRLLACVTVGTVNRLTSFDFVVESVLSDGTTWADAYSDFDKALAFYNFKILNSATQENTP